MTPSKSRGYVFTFNTFDENTEAYLQDEVDCQYLAYGYEIAPTTGRPHLQGYVYFFNTRSFNGVLNDFKKYGKEPFLRAAKGAAEQNFDYISKDGAYFERGIRPKSNESKGSSEQQRWTQALAAAKEGRMDDIPADIYYRYYSTTLKIAAAHLPTVLPLDEQSTYGLWIYGPPRTGKSHHARTNYNPLYLKGKNKWWDRYNGEPYVLIDEVQPSDVWITDFLKIWVDRWPFSAEIKGGTTTIRPKLIMVTSNFRLDECFTGVNLEALRLRFNVMHIPFRII